MYVRKQVQNTGIGTKSQQALKLQQEQLKTERKAVSREQREAEKQLQFELKKLQESFQDNGIEEVNDVVMKVYMEIDRHLDDVTEVRNVLKQYAEILRRN